MKKHTYLRRHERLNEIIITALGQRQNGKRTFTNARMAKWLGLSVSSRLKRMLDELVEEGWLQREEKIHRSSWHKDGYKLEIKKHEYTLSETALNKLVII